MEPSRDEEDAIVDLVDVILRDGAVLQADAIITVAGVPLIGLKLRAALAGMDTMTEYGLLEEWDRRARGRALEADERADSENPALENEDTRNERSAGNEDEESSQ